MSAPLHQRPGGAQIDTGAMHACRADACRQGRAPCPCPDACAVCEYEAEQRTRWRDWASATAIVGLLFFTSILAAMAL